MCCKNSRHREKGKVGPSDEGSYKEQNRENFARLDKKRKEREKAEKKRQQIKEAKLRREERGAWVSSLNPFGRQERAAYRGGEVLLKAQEDDLEAPPSGAKEPNPFSFGLIDALAMRKTPVDFFSWHFYTSNTELLTTIGA